ncbi:MAG: DUF6056 family protein [Erysipelotrichaceae bacterium]
MKRKLAIGAGALIMFSLFLYISTVSPLAGDDWGYAINGLKQNPILTAFEFYNGWSGRFFSELLGFILTNHKAFWNVLNACLFSGLLVLMYEICKSKKNWVIQLLVIFFLMLSVKDQLRMETYTWIMGTSNYTIALFIIVLILFLYQTSLQGQPLRKWKIVVIGIVNFVGSMMVENAAVIVLLVNASVLVYIHLHYRKQKKVYVGLTAISLIGLILLRISPGAAARLSDYTEWTQMNMIEKICVNWPNFMQYTLLDNKYLIMVLSLCTLVFVMQKVRDIKIKIPLIIVYLFSLFQSVSAYLYAFSNVEYLRCFFDTDVSATFWITTILLVCMVAGYFYLFTLLEDTYQWTVYTVLIAAGIGNGSMLISPVVGSRNSLFTVYLLIIIITIIIGHLKLNKVYSFMIIAMALCLNLYFVHSYVERYALVNQINIERMAQIEYYKNNPDETQAWIVRMPIMSIHSADVEEWDTYHMETFKEYYGLNPDMEIIFYYKDSY